jgi:hypothetical protein
MAENMPVLTPTNNSMISSVMRRELALFRRELLKDIEVLLAKDKPQKPEAKK